MRPEIELTLLSGNAVFEDFQEEDFPKKKTV
jgi:hypothetical protein